MMVAASNKAKQKAVTPTVLEDDTAKYSNQANGRQGNQYDSNWHVFGLFRRAIDHTKKVITYRSHEVANVIVLQQVATVVTI